MAGTMNQLTQTVNGLFAKSVQKNEREYLHRANLRLLALVFLVLILR